MAKTKQDSNEQGALHRVSHAGRRDFLKSALTIGSAAGVAGFTAACASNPQNIIVAATPQAQVAPTGDKLAEVLNRGKLLAGVTLTVPPWGYTDENNQPTGYDIDIARLLAKQLFKDPTKVELVEQAYDARIPNLLSGKTDIALQSMTVTAERAQVVEFTIPYYREAYTIMMLKDSPYNGKDMTGKGVTVSGLQNSFLEDQIHTGVPDAKILALDSVENAILAVDTKRADGTIIDLSIGRYYVARFPDKYKTGDLTWGGSLYAAAVAPGNQRWLNYLNTAMHVLLAGDDFPDFRTAFKKYFGVDLADVPAGYPIEYGVRS